MNIQKKDLTELSVLGLVAANVIPIFGVLYFKWDTFSIVLLYWAENLVIGFYNILKIAVAKVARPIEHLGKLFLIPFFIVHFGGFAAVHGIFILLLFGKGQSLSSGPGQHPWPCFLVFVQLLIGVIWQVYSTIPANMKIAIAALFVSHGVSFVDNFLLKGEFASAKPKDLMGQPYSRVVVMHIAIIAGAFVSAALRSAAGILLVLIVLKTILDVKLHLRQHRNILHPAPFDYRLSSP
jgi:hypothetical protein